MAIATQDGICKRCGQPYMAGERILSFNLPKPGPNLYHPACVAKPAQDWTQKAETTYALPSPFPTAVNVQSSPVIAPVKARGSDALLDVITDAVSERISLAGLTDENKVREIAKEEARVEDQGTLTTIAEMIAECRDTVAEQIKAAMATIQPTVIELRRSDAPPVTIEGAHYMMPRVAALIEAGIHVYLWGPPGTGKTTVLLQLADKLGRPYEVDTLDASTPKSAILGYKNLDKTPSETAFTRTYVQERGMYIGEETDLMPSGVATIFNTSLANGHAAAGWGMIARGKGWVYCGNGNTPGAPTKEFPERKKMSEAFKDRLYFVHWPIDANIENRACGLPFEPTPERKVWTCTVAQWGTWVKKCRAYCAVNFPTLYVGSRATHTGLLALACGETPLEVAHGVVFRGLDAPSVDKILAACPLPEGD